MFHTSSPFYQASPSSWWHSRPFSFTSSFPHALLFSSGYWELNLPSLMTGGLSETPAELQSPGRREGGAQRQRRPTLPPLIPAPRPSQPWTGPLAQPSSSSQLPAFPLELLHVMSLPRSFPLLGQSPGWEDSPAGQKSG